MAQKILDVLMLGRCSHEFSWPRRAADGHYYQVCLLCAAEYKYDWKTMRRIERVQPAQPESTAKRGKARVTMKTIDVSRRVASPKRRLLLLVANAASA